jgi:hypothetical protein
LGAIMTLPKGRFLSFLVALAAPLALSAACSGQGEGERCSTAADNNGNDDCAGSLVCYPKDKLNGSSTDRCCPFDRTQATTVVCAIGSAVGIDAAPPVDTGTSADATGTDSASDSSTDAGDAANSDSGAVDAPADG